MNILIPKRIDGLLGYSRPCACGATHTVELRQASIDKGALVQLIPMVRSCGLGMSSRVAVVFDRVTRQLCGEALVKDLVRAGYEVRECEVEDSHGGRPHATEECVELVRDSLSDRDWAVAVGAGTINDLVKLASFRRGIPYIVVPTAPSMNGYASGIAAILQDGVKRTVPCHQPLAMVADLDILTAAPRHLVAAGLGDLESKPTATADYRLSAMLRGEAYCAVPEQVVLEAERRVAQAGAEIGRGDPQAIAVLFEALVLSGISMKLAGTSAPASGGEHLLSHFWDMRAPLEGRVEGWHGAQVGVATLVTAALYEELSLLEPEEIDVDRLVRARLGLDEQKAAARARWPEHGEEVAREVEAGYLPDPSQAELLRRLRGSWKEMWESLADVLRPASAIAGILRAAGAPTTMAELGLGRSHLLVAYRHAREIRRRYTVLDLAFDLDVLAALESRVLSRCAVL